ncbi:uncharacterized protein LOC143218715 [Lasioglossum baleicum]|uniref:uncharacterized protein LOC143218715 n=1 Tax=Lasioglossum baleicum TaxID=434251 RepID=UPI003FCED2C2
MIGGTIRRIVLLCLVNAILVAGSSRIYAEDLPRNRRDASCPSCSRDRPDALANWSSPPRESREASSSSWASSISQPLDSVPTSSWASSISQPLDSEQSSPMVSSPLQPQSWQSSPFQSPSLQYPGLQPPASQFPQPGSPYSLNPLNPYRGAIGGRGGPGVIRPWSTSRRENPFSFGTRDLNSDLAPAPASSLYSLNPPVSPVVPFQPYSPVIRTSDRVPYGRSDIFGLSRSQSSQLSQGNVDYSPIQTGSVFNNPKSKLSVVYRADKYSDDSNEDDNVPLYPSDYPRRLVVGGQDNVYPSGYPRIWRGQGLVNRGLQDNSPSFPVDYLRRVATAESQNARNVAAVQLSRAETIVNPQRELRVLNGAGNIVSPFRDTRMADTVTNPQEDLQDAVVGAALRQSQTDRVQDARMTDRIMQGDQSRTDRIAQPQKHQPRDSRMADKFVQPQIDQTQDARVLQSLAQSLKDQPRESRMAGRFVQPQDQARDTRMAEQFSQPPADNPRLSSIMQVPEGRPRNLPSEMEIFKVIQQIGNMFANRSSQEDPQKEQERGQQGVQLAKQTNENDQVQESKVSPGPGEVKEKRDVADGERVPVMQNDMVELDSLEGIMPMTTSKILTISPIETMD